MKKANSAGARARTTFYSDFVPERDPAYPLIMDILRVVPASRWAFARLRPDGELAGLLVDEKENGGELRRLKGEFERQREMVKVGPRLAATLGPLGDFESGITLLFADAHSSFGILTLLRTSELGPFTSSEISVLALSLDATSERLSALPLDPPGKRSRVKTESGAAPETRAADSEEAFYVLDRDLQIVLAWTCRESTAHRANGPAYEDSGTPAGSARGNRARPDRRLAK